MVDKLPCPVCNSDELYEKKSMWGWFYDELHWEIVCDDCEEKGPVTRVPTVEGAWIVWNKRAAVAKPKGITLNLKVSTQDKRFDKYIRGLVMDMQYRGLTHFDMANVLGISDKPAKVLWDKYFREDWGTINRECPAPDCSFRQEPNNIYCPCCKTVVLQCEECGFYGEPHDQCHCGGLMGYPWD